MSPGKAYKKMLGTIFPNAQFVIKYVPKPPAGLLQPIDCSSQVCGYLYGFSGKTTIFPRTSCVYGSDGSFSRSLSLGMSTHFAAFKIVELFNSIVVNTMATPRVSIQMRIQYF